MEKAVWWCFGRWWCFRKYFLILYQLGVLLCILFFWISLIATCSIARTFGYKTIAELVLQVICKLGLLLYIIVVETYMPMKLVLRGLRKNKTPKLVTYLFCLIPCPTVKMLWVPQTVFGVCRFKGSVRDALIIFTTLLN
jgi:hypothetical protein